MTSIRPKFALTSLLVGACLALFALAGACAFAQSTKSSKKPIPLIGKPISLIGLEDAFKGGGLVDAELIKLVKSRGVDFVLTPEIGNTLRGLGASQALIQAVGANYRGIEGTTWNFLILDTGKNPTFTYAPGGVLHNSFNSPPVGTWTLHRDEVYMEETNKSIEYHGTVSGTHMGGTVVSKATGWNSTWTADEVEEANDSGKSAPNVSTVTPPSPTVPPRITARGLEGAIKAGGLQDSQLIAQIQSRGVDFILTPEIADTLRGLGASGAVIEAVGANYRGTPAPKKATTANKVNLSADVVVGLLIQKTIPQYPPIAKAARVSGTVVLKATISEQGTIESLQVVSGPELLQQAALDAVKTWRYRPYLFDNEPMEVDTTINVIFTLGR